LPSLAHPRPFSYPSSLLSFPHPAPSLPPPLPLHDALPISSPSAPSGRPPARYSGGSCSSTWGQSASWCSPCRGTTRRCWRARSRSEEHTSELQSRFELVCRLLREKKKKTRKSVEELAWLID